MAENRQRGLLRVVSELGVTTPVETSQAAFTAPDPGIERAAGQVAGDFARLGDKIGRLADHAAAKEGAEEGRQAGVDPEFRPTRLATIRGEAYDRAGLEVYRTRQDLALAEELDKVYTAHRGDPAKLAAAIDETRRAWLQSSLPETRPDLEVSFQKHRLTYMRQALREQDERVRHEAAAAAQEKVAASLRTITQRAYALGLDANADEVLASDIAELKGVLARRGPDGKPLVPPEAAGKLMRAATEEVATARLMGAFNRLPDLEAKTRFLEQLRSDFAAGKGLAGEFDLDGIRRVEAQLADEMRKEGVRVGTAERGVRHEVEELFRMAGKGFTISADKMSALSARVAGLRNPEVAAAFDEARDFLSWHRQAASSSPDELAAHLDQLRAASRDDASPRLVRRLEIGEKLLGEMRTQVKQDPLGWAARTGLVPYVEPLDLSTPEKAAASLTARIAQAETVAARYGIAPQYLRPDEVRLIGTEMGKGGAETLAMTALLSGAGERAPAILRQLSDQAPAMAYLGGLGLRLPDAPVVADAAAGLARRRTLGTEFKPTVAPAPQLRDLAVGVTGVSMARLDVNMQAAMDVASAAYEVRAHWLGLSRFDGSVWQQAFREALGERTIDGVTYGGVYARSRGFFSFSAPPVILPTDMTGPGFEAAIDALTADDLRDLQGRMPSREMPDRTETPVSLADFKAGTLVSVGDGRYRIALGDPFGGKPDWLVAGGRPYVLDFRQLGALRRRRPDLFLGADVPRHDGEPAR